MATPTTVHLVGSLPYDTEEEAFILSSQALPNRLLRIPDGETGSRQKFIAWQSFVFPTQVLGPIHRRGKPLEDTDFDYTLDDIEHTGYDKAAIKSYQTFSKLKIEGTIPQATRFQVSIPTPINTCFTHVDYRYRGQVESLYMQRLIQDLESLQSAIPAKDLAIQIDMAMEFAYLEYDKGRLKNPLFKPHFSKVEDHILERVTQLASSIGPEVQLGFHLCYGDRECQHFIQPEDASLLVSIANNIVKRVGVSHPIKWIHMPVPKDRLDVTYFAPLKGLEIGGTELFLGLAHANDMEGTKERMKVAQSVYGRPFGISTECGLGRMTVKDAENVLSIMRNVTVPETAA
ncbi:hypothetical protein ACLMJK_006463 [Lecanora helva]